MARVAPKKALPAIRPLNPVTVAHGVWGQVAVWNEARKNRKIAAKLREDETWLRSEQETLEAAKRREMARAAVEVIEDEEVRKEVLKKMGVDPDT